MLTLSLLFAMVLFPTLSLAKTGLYYVLSDGGATITYYYGEHDFVWENNLSNPYTEAWPLNENAASKITKAVFDESARDFHPKSLSSFFSWVRMRDDITVAQGYPNLKTIEGLDLIDTSKCENMSFMFNGCSSLTELDLSSFKTGAVTNMGAMFQSCTSLAMVNVSSWDTSSATDMSAMFSNCSSLTSLDLSSWNTSQSTNMKSMLSKCSSLSKIELSNEFAFGAGSNHAGLRTDISWQSSADGETYTSDSIPNNIASTYTAISRLYKQYNSNTRTLTYKYGTGKTDTYYKGEVEKIIVDESVKDCDEEFNFSWHTKARTIEGLNNINTGGWTSLSQMFYYCSSLTELDLSSWDTKNVSDMSEAFSECGALVSLKVSNWDTGNVNNMRETFFHCTALSSLDVSKWNMSNVTDMSGAFTLCFSLTSLNLSNWNTSKVVNMEEMFYGCALLYSLDFSKWNTSNVEDMSSMFEGCSFLNSLNISGWDTAKVADMWIMFRNCGNLETLSLGKKFTFGGNSEIAALRSDVSWRSSSDGCVYAYSNIPSFVAATYTATTEDSTPWNPGPAPAIVSSTEMHRLYNPNSGEHFYTADTKERNHLVSVGWTFEGRGWIAPAISNKPVYRLYNANAGDHHYTMSVGERDALVAVGWNYEGLGWYSADASGAPLYRQYNPNALAGSHNYTLDMNENNALVQLGWRAEGIGWYGLK